MNQCFDHSFDREEEPNFQIQDEEVRVCVCVVKNVAGIHVRPASSLVQLIEHDECEVSFTYEEKTINAKSIIGILMLGVPQGGKVNVRVQGKNADRVMEKIKELFASGFGEL